MNEIYEKNLLNFRLNKEKLIEYKTNTDENQILCVETKDGNKGLCIKRDNKALYVHSKYYPIKEAKRWTESIKENIYNYVIFGLGLGYHIEVSLNKINSEGNILIIIPEKEFLYDLLQLKSYKEIFKNHNIYIHILEDKLSVKAFLLKHIQWKRMNSIEFFYIPAYEKIYANELHMTAEALRESILINRINEGTSVNFSQKWQRNIFENMPFILESIPISVFKETFNNTPAIVVSAGPSLNKNVHLLKNIKNKALILCVDTALNVLLNEGIKPDLIFSVDGGDLTYEKFRGVKYEDIPLVYSPKSNPKIISQHKDKKVIFVQEKYIGNLFERKGYNIYLKVGGSVATVAFQFARYINADPIIFVGQDLAFTAGEGHAKGTMYDKMENLFEGRKMLHVKGNIEEKVYTDYTFKSYLDWFQDCIMYDNTKREYINATEGGAYIEGTKVMTLQEVINKYCNKNYDVEIKLKEILSLDKIFTRQDIIDIYKMHKNSTKDLKKVQNKVEKAIDLVKKVLSLYKEDKHNKSEINKILKELDYIDKYIKEKDIDLIGHIVQRYIIEMNYKLYRNEKPNETEKEKGIRIMNGNLVLYEGIYNSIKETLEIMEKYFDEMNNKYNID